MFAVQRGALGVFLLAAAGCGKQAPRDETPPAPAPAATTVPTGTRTTAAEPPDPLAAPKARSRESLAAIAAAFARYEAANGHSPVGLLDPKTGQIGLSWRVQILPHLPDPAAAVLYTQFRLDEPWDSDHNRPLVGMMPSVFAHARNATPPGRTYYQGFADRHLAAGGKEFPPDPTPRPGFGEGFAFFPDPRVRHQLPPGDPVKGLPLVYRKIDQVRDGTDNTFLVAEAAEAVPWTSPRDIAFRFVLEDAYDQARGPERTGRWDALGGPFDGAFHAVSVSGNALVFVPKTAPAEKLRPFITIGGLVDSDFEGLGLQRPRYP
jgi:hypothetical protein